MYLLIYWAMNMTLILFISLSVPVLQSHICKELTGKLLSLFWWEYKTKQKKDLMLTLVKLQRADAESKEQHVTSEPQVADPWNRLLRQSYSSPCSGFCLHLTPVQKEKAQISLFLNVVSKTSMEILHLQRIRNSFNTVSGQISSYSETQKLSWIS